MSIIKPIVITKPFCNSGTKILPPATSSALIANQEDGYPPAQANTQAMGGLPVKRDQTNGIFNLYSQICAWVNAGGTFTFEADIANNGGYPKNAILYCDSNNSWQRSLKDNNVANFITNTSFINDGINWSDMILNHLPNIIKNKYYVYSWGKSRLAAQFDAGYWNIRISGDAELMSSGDVSIWTRNIDISNFGISALSESISAKVGTVSLISGLDTTNHSITSANVGVLNSNTLQIALQFSNGPVTGPIVVSFTCDILANGLT